MIVFLLLGAGLVLLALAADAKGAVNVVKGKYKFTWADVLPLETLRGMIRDAARAAGIGAAQVAAIVYIESRGNPNAVNPSDPSYGLGQIMLPTARAYADLADPVTPDTLVRDPALNLKCASRYLADLSRKYAARFDFAEWAQAYNVGETKFNKGVRNPAYGAKVYNTETGMSDFLNPGQLAALLYGEF